MPGQRAPDQKAVLIMMRDAFIHEIDRLVPLCGYSDRSAFIRDAVYEKLESMGYKLPREISTAPARTGKGGRPKNVTLLADAPDSLPITSGKKTINYRKKQK